MQAENNHLMETTRKKIVIVALLRGEHHCCSSATLSLSALSAAFCFANACFSCATAFLPVVLTSLIVTSR